MLGGTDGYYIYTWDPSTRQIYAYSARLAASATAQPVATFTLPQAAVNNNYSLSWANGILSAPSASSYYGFRLTVTP